MKDDLNIPTFLQRPAETEAQAEVRRAKNKPKDKSAGVKLKKMPEPKDPKIAKAIEKDFKVTLIGDKDHVKAQKATVDNLKGFIEKGQKMQAAVDKIIAGAKAAVPKKAGSLVERAAKLRDQIEEKAMAKREKKIAKALEPKSAKGGKTAEKKAKASASKSVDIADLHKSNHPIAKANADSWKAVTGGGKKEKKVTIGAVASTAILAGDNNEAALKKVMKAFPDCSSNLGCMAWYRNKLRKEGKLKVPQKAR